jgi:hypothetical protein
MLRKLLPLLMLAAAMALALHNTAIAVGSAPCDAAHRADGADQAPHITSDAGAGHQGAAHHSPSADECCGTFCSSAIVGPALEIASRPAPPELSPDLRPSAIPPPLLDRPPRRLAA